jgi:hypothetical protein
VTSTRFFPQAQGNLTRKRNTKENMERNMGKKNKNKIKKKNIRKVDINEDKLAELSEFYKTVFLSDVDQENQDIQKEVRAKRNCKPHPEIDTAPEDFNTDHDDSHITTITCVPVHYRIPSSSVKGIKDSIVFGVLSGDKHRRDVVRETWAKDSSTFFITAGDWKSIEDEYNEYGDMIWIDMEDQYRAQSYKPRKGALTFKTSVFFIAMYEHVVKESPDVEQFFKTDDDSYINKQFLIQEIERMSKEIDIDYWGHCKGQQRAIRYELDKWYDSFLAYPYTYYPTFCVGAGFMVSPKFLDCMVGEGEIGKIPYMVNEDVFTGSVAERCNIEPASLYQTGKEMTLWFDKNLPDLNSEYSVIHEVKNPEKMFTLHENYAQKD